MSAAASTRLVPMRNARWKPAVRACGGRAVGEELVGAVGGDRGEDGEPERAAELHGGVEQPGGDAGLVGRDAFGGGGGDAGEDGAEPDATTAMPGSRSVRKEPSTGAWER